MMKGVQGRVRERDRERERECWKIDCLILSLSATIAHGKLIRILYRQREEVCADGSSDGDSTTHPLAPFPADNPFAPFPDMAQVLCKTEGLRRLIIYSCSWLMER